MEGKRSTWQSAAQASSLGFEIVLSLAVGYLLGKWLDGKLGIYPWLTVVFSLAGVGSAVRAMVRVVRQYRRDFPDTDAPGSGTAGPGKNDASQGGHHAN